MSETRPIVLDVREVDGRLEVFDCVSGREVYGLMSCELSQPTYDGLCALHITTLPPRFAEEQANRAKE